MSSVTIVQELAALVLKKYSIIPDQINVIQGGNIKTVWKVKTADRTLCLKRLKQNYDKALFSVNAQIHIKNNSGNVPGILLGIDGEPIVQFEDQLFVLYQWVEGKDLYFDNPDDLKNALQGLAYFHIASKNYEPPDECRISSKQGKWPEQYNSMKEKFAEWKIVSENNAGKPVFDTYRLHVDKIIEISESAINLLNTSGYGQLTQDMNHLVLCHQDYGKGNAIMTPTGVCVIDLDGVTFDLPSRDLRKIIGKQAENIGKWEQKNIENIISIYCQVNQLTKEETEVLFIDLLFPHWFFGLVKNLFKNNKMLKASEIEKIARLEESKVKVLKEMLL